MEIITTSLKLFPSFNISFKPIKLAPASAGIDKKKEIFAASTLLNFKNLQLVITTPDRLAPGIKATIWLNPITRISFIVKSFLNFFFIFFYLKKKVKFQKLA